LVLRELVVVLTGKADQVYCHVAYVSFLEQNPGSFLANFLDLVGWDARLREEEPSVNKSLGFKLVECAYKSDVAAWFDIVAHAWLTNVLRSAMGH